MKKHAVVVALVAAVAGGAVYAGAADPSADAFGIENQECGKKGKKFFGRMAKKLNLTDAQKKEIQAIIEEERVRTEPLRQKLAEGRKALQQATEAETFDEAAVKSLAANQTNLKAELMVSHLKVRNRIHTLLTPEQRELAKKMRQKHGKGHKGAGMF